VSIVGVSVVVDAEMLQSVHADACSADD